MAPQSLTTVTQMANKTPVQGAQHRGRPALGMLHSERCGLQRCDTCGWSRFVLFTIRALTCYAHVSVLTTDNPLKLQSTHHHVTGRSTSGWRNGWISCLCRSQSLLHNEGIEKMLHSLYTCNFHLYLPEQCVRFFCKSQNAGGIQRVSSICGTVNASAPDSTSGPQTRSRP